MPLAETGVGTMSIFAALSSDTLASVWAAAICDPSEREALHETYKASQVYIALALRPKLAPSLNGRPSARVDHRAGTRSQSSQGQAGGERRSVLPASLGIDQLA